MATLSLLKKIVDDGLLKKLVACQSGSKISHLFFADDSLIFCLATKGECSNLKRLLETCEQAFGEQLNQEKTSLFSNRNTP